MNFSVVKAARALTLMLAMAFLACGSNAQSTDSDFVVKSIGGTSHDQGLGIVLDSSGNIHTTGWFSGTVDFDPGRGTFSLTSNGRFEIFVSKLDSNGNFLWAKSMGGAGRDGAFDIAVDGSGNVYITGFFQETADFDPGSGAFNLTSSGLEDVFVAKLDSNGAFLWAKAISGELDDRGLSIAVDVSGNVYTTGYFQETAVFDPGPGAYNLTGAGSFEIFVSKLDGNGDLVWAKSIGGSGSDRGVGVAVDSSGNIYITGRFQKTVDFDTGPGDLSLTSSGSSDVFVSKLDNDGNSLWTRSMGGASADQGMSIAVDVSGNIYTTGYFQETADFNPGPGTTNLTSNGESDIFVFKLDSNGDLLWARSMGGKGLDLEFGIALDGSGNVYTTGYFQETADFDPGPGVFNLESDGSEDIFVSKFDSNGNFLSANSMGGTGLDRGFGIALDVSGDVHITGYFQETADLDPGAGVSNRTSKGNFDIFISKLSRLPP